MRHLSIKTKITVYVSLLIVTLMSALAFYTMNLFEIELKNSITEQEATMAAALATEIDNKLATAQNALIAISKALPVETVEDPDAVQLYLDNRLAAKSIFDNHLYLFSPQGLLIAESGFKEDRRGMNFSYRDYIRYTALMNRPFISAPYISSLPHHHPVIMCTTPIVNAEGHLIAILGGGIDLMNNNFLGDLSRVQIGKTGYVDLRTTDGIMIMHPDRSQIMQRNVYGAEGINLNSLPPPSGVSMETVDYRGTVVLSTFQVMRSTDWLLGLHHPISEAYAPLLKMAVYFLAATLLLMLAAVWIASRLARRITGPLLQLTRHINQLPGKTGAGRLCQIHSTDEVGALTLAFNGMVQELDRQSAELQKHNSYLKTLHETSLTMLNRLDVDELLMTVIRRAADFTGTKNSGIYLLDKAETGMELRVGIGLYQSQAGASRQLHQGLVGSVWASGETLLIADYATWSGRNPDPLSQQFHAAAALPLKSANRVVGILILLHTELDRTFTADDLFLLTHFAELVSIALDNAQLYTSSQYLSLHDPLTGLYNRNYFEEEIRRLELSRETSGGIIICDVDNLKLVNDALGHAAGDALLIAIANIFRQSFRGSDIAARIGGDEFAVLLPTQSTQTITDACQRIREGIASCPSPNPLFPLSLSIGSAVQSDKRRSIQELFKQADANMYREKLLHRQNKRKFTLRIIANALDNLDFSQLRHKHLLGELTTALAEAAGLSKQRIVNLKLLTRFQNIGIIGLPHHILSKPDALDTEEREMICRHSEIGYRIAHSLPELTLVADYILKHHEHWNGCGYPLNLAGNTIPIECRILAITDAYCAMIDERPFRKAMTTVEAIAELKRCAGKQFDPQLIKLCVCILEK